MIWKFCISLLILLQPLDGQRNIHERWEGQLQRYIAPTGRINYQDWQKERHALAAYLQALEDFPPQDHWNQDDRKAYWINVYNAATIALVLDNYPIESLGSVPDYHRIEIFSTTDRLWTLESIEDHLREMSDPRVLFALHRAAVSGPQLMKTAYRSNTIDEQLDRATKTFFSDPTKNQCQTKKRRLSQLLMWYAEDLGSPKAQLEFLEKYGCSNTKKSTRFSYLPFDWQLNE